MSGMDYYDCRDRVNYFRLDSRFNEELHRLRNIYRTLYSSLEGINLIVSAKLKLNSLVTALTARLQRRYPEREYLAVHNGAVFNVEPDGGVCLRVYREYSY